MLAMIRRRTWVIVLGLVVIGLLLHPWLLSGLARPISRGDGVAEASHLLFLRSARAAPAAFDFARDFVLADSSRRILVFQNYVRRAEAIGAGLPFVETTIGLLVESGVPEEQIEVIGDPNIITTTETMGYMVDWLQTQSSDTNLLVITHSFRSGYITTVTDAVVPAAVRGRLHVVGFERSGVNATNWWKSATGLKLFFAESMRRIHLSVYGNRRPPVAWDPDRYEASLRALKP